MIAPPDFNRVARPYRYLEYMTLGPVLQRCRTHYIPQLLDRTEALVLGDGDGRFLAKLLAVNRNLRATAVDTSTTMLQLLRSRCGDTSRLTICNESARVHTPSPATDLVTAHFFFDCLTQPELDGLIARTAAQIRPDALWLVSDFQIPTGSMRLPAKLFIRGLYFAFNILTGLRTTQLPDHEAPLRRAGLQLKCRHRSLFGLLTTELWSRL